MRISVGKSRKDLNWKVEETTWDELCDRLSETFKTRETYDEYKQMKQDERGAIKDVGGFVGGVIEGGRRKRDAVKSRSLITLDADFAGEDIWGAVTCFNEFTMCMYSTHNHSPKLPRVRFVIPLDREVSPEEYEPIARRIADDFGIEQFDTTTYEASRLMYWPSTSKDAEFVFKRLDGAVLSADATLARYKDWKDSSKWPMAASETTIRTKEAKRQGDPCEKIGIVGLFCRAYDIDSAISEFLPEVYLATDDPHRYTFVNGSTFGGLVVYENGKFAYSHHSTDPAGGQLCNAFDLIRLHKYGGLDYQMKPDTPITKTPSYIAMQKFATEDPNVKRLSVAERMETSQLDFVDDSSEESVDWMPTLKINKMNEIEKRITNMNIIILNDPNLKGKIGLDVFAQRITLRGSVPWRKLKPDDTHQWIDSDMSGLRQYLEGPYDLVAVNGMLRDAWINAAEKNFYHPVRDYLAPLVWDGIPRVETVFIDYMDCEDTPYARTVTKKWLTAAVARVMEPGIKFDSMIVLVGAQGIGKSMFADRLARTWFTDSITSLNGKDPLEKIQGRWICEMPELSALTKKTDVEQFKQFMVSRHDSYRPAYKENVETFPRQCVFMGSTNDTHFLKDNTGNRRYWTLTTKTTPRGAKKLFNQMTPEVVDQIWAEAKTYYAAGETLYLDDDMSDIAKIEQSNYMEVNEWLGILEDYLNKPLPTNWPRFSPSQKREYAQGYETPGKTEDLTYVRNTFSLPEVDWELYGSIAGTKKLHEIKESHNQLLALHDWVKSPTRQRTKDYGLQYVYHRKVKEGDEFDGL